MICDAFCHSESEVATGLLSRNRNLYQKLAWRLISAFWENLGFHTVSILLWNLNRYRLTLKQGMRHFLPFRMQPLPPDASEYLSLSHPPPLLLLQVEAHPLECKAVGSSTGWKSTVSLDIYSMISVMRVYVWKVFISPYALTVHIEASQL